MANGKRVAVLGAGAWGTALAAAACRQSDVMLWGRRQAAISQMQLQGVNQDYLPDIALPQTLRYTADLAQALAHVTEAAEPGLIVLGTPMAGLAQICAQIQQWLGANRSIAGLVWTCKGLTAQGGQLPHELVAQALKDCQALDTGVLSGPSFAKEVALGLPVALTIASESEALRDEVTAVFHSHQMRIYGSNDVIGVEVGGALKNIMAIACGISDALGLGNNARAALITRGLAEMTRFGVALGAIPSTFAGLTGLGDLVLTATGELSRNRQLGLRIGAGESLEDILSGGTTAEGARCVQAVLARASALGIPMPIAQAVSDTLFGDISPAKAVERLMTRAAAPE